MTYPLIMAGMNQPSAPKAAYKPSTKKFFEEQLPHVAGAPFGFELIEARKEQRYRVHDREDDPVGSAETAEEAAEMVAELNRRFGYTA